MLGCIGVDEDGFAFAEFACEDFLCQRVFDPLLDHALQRPCAERRIVTFLGQQLLGLVGDDELEIPRRQSLAQVFKLHVDDLRELLLAQRVEDDRLVDAVEELGAEVLLEQVLDGRLDLPLLARLCS